MGSLEESLKKFRKQQENCQTILTSNAAKGGPKTSATPKVVPASTLTKSPVPGVKFSEDAQRLQYIYSIRKLPVGAQIKRVIDLLLETREAFTPEEINDASYVDVNDNKAVFDSLRNNPKVYFDGKCFSYKPKHGVKDKNEVLDLIREFPEGIAVVDLKDAYPTVFEDLKSLKEAREIWLLSSSDSQDQIAYPNDKDPRVAIKVDDDVKQLYQAIKLPQDMIDIEKDLQKNGMKPATNSEMRRAMQHILGIGPKPKRKKKQREITKRTKLTNVHLPELFKHLNDPGP